MEKKSWILSKKELDEIKKPKRFESVAFNEVTVMLLLHISELLARVEKKLKNLLDAKTTLELKEIKEHFRKKYSVDKKING